LATLVKRDKELVKLDTNARHEIRIDAKKLRYMAEFFLLIRGVAKQPEQYKLMINCCEKLQEAIGAIRDEEARAEFMQSGRWPEDWSPDTRVSTAGPDNLSPRLRLQTIVAKNLRKAVKAHSKLAVTDPF
jgi:triphosphatase